MTVAVRYHCPHCGAVVTLEREARLADRAVTPHPLEHWSYVPPDGPIDTEMADGIALTCGVDAGVATWADDGCNQALYLSFVRYDRGQPVDPAPVSRPQERQTGGAD
ncbi:MAG: hypothetical protein ABEJ35_07990 [Halobacteriaceae archaeon]